jgi:hypothetical protein
MEAGEKEIKERREEGKKERHKERKEIRKKGKKERGGKK